MSNELLEKVIRTTEIGSGGGGLLNAEQTNRFIDYMWDVTVLGQQVRKIRMRSTVQDIDKIGVGQRLARVATEAVDDGVNAGVTFSKISITVTKFRLDYELSTESLEDNIEGDSLEGHITRLMATQFGNDLEDVAINGDTALTTDPLLKGFNGWSKRALTGGVVVDNGGNGLDRAAFNRAIRAMPRVFMQRRGDLKFFVGSNLIQDYLFSLTQTASGTISLENVAAGILDGPVRAEGAAGFTGARPFGIPLQEVPLFDTGKAGSYSGASGAHGDVWLTDPKNLLWGVKREIQVYREFKPKKDTIEYTVYVRMGVQIENLAAFVVVRNVKGAA